MLYDTLLQFTYPRTRQSDGNKHIKAIGYILVQWQGTQLTPQSLSREAIMNQKM